MQTQVNKSPHAVVWIAGIAITLFCLTGIAAFMGWIPTSMGSPVDAQKVATAPAEPAAVKLHTPQAHIAKNIPARIECPDCGVVESTREIVQPGKGSGIGGIGGAVVGGVLGHQVGSGRGNDLATVAGAVGGAFAGNEIEKRVQSTKSYEITVRFESGSSRVFNETSPTWHTGDRVRVIDGVIKSNA